MKKSALYKSLFEHCFKGLSFYLEAGIWIRIWIRIRVKSRIQIRIRIRIKEKSGSGSASNKNKNADLHHGDKFNLDPHQVMLIHNTG
jgi:hypothetical protein